MINTPKTKQTAIFIPTFGRPHALHRVIDNLFENTPEDLFTAYFILEQGDSESYAIAQRLRARVIFNSGLPCYADAINTAYRKTLEPYFFTGADDLGFEPKWLETALSYMKDGKQVVGTNDLGSIPIGEQRDATHYLVKTSYINKHSGVVDIPNTVLYFYKHNYTDKEFVETARSRDAYIYAPDSRVNHFHPVWNKGQWDATYKRGNETSEEDKRTFLQRQHLWQK